MGVDRSYVTQGAHLDIGQQVKIDLSRMAQGLEQPRGPSTRGELLGEGGGFLDRG